MLRHKSIFHLAVLFIFAFAMLAGSANGVQAAIGTLIDHFDTSPSQGTTATWNGSLVTESSSVVDGAVLGGARDLTVSISNGSNPGQTIQANVNLGGDSKLTIATGSTLRGRTIVQWDGNDGSPTLSATGLGGVDLEAGGFDRFLLAISSQDVPATLIIRVYTDATNWSQYSFLQSETIYSFQPKIFPIMYSNFIIGDGTGADFTNVGAVELEVDGTALVSSDLDITIHLLETSDGSYEDFGDLPSGYNLTLLANNGARHLTDGLQLGATIDSESDGQPSDIISGGDGTDEDGVTPTPNVNWVTGTDGGSVDVTVSGCNNTCYLNAWINWNTGSDFDFDDTGEQVLIDEPVVNGPQTITFDIPGTVTFGKSFDSRFRLYQENSGGGAAPTGDALNGEVEDYNWAFGPTAIQLESLKASANPTNRVAISASLVTFLLLGSLGLFIWYRRKEA